MQFSQIKLDTEKQELAFICDGVVVYLFPFRKDDMRLEFKLRKVMTRQKEVLVHMLGWRKCLVATWGAAPSTNIVLIDAHHSTYGIGRMVEGDIT